MESQQNNVGTLLAEQKKFLSADGQALREGSPVEAATALAYLHNGRAIRHIVEGTIGRIRSIGPSWFGTSAVIDFDGVGHPYTCDATSLRFAVRSSHPASNPAVGPAVDSLPATPVSQGELRDLMTEALYKVQRRALVDASAAISCARRYVARFCSGTVQSYQDRMVESYLAGLRGDQNRYGAGYGGNFTSRLRGAYRAGKQLRDELIADGYGVVEVTATSAPAPTPGRERRHGLVERNGRV